MKNSRKNLSRGRSAGLVPALLLASFLVLSVFLAACGNPAAETPENPATPPDTTALGTSITEAEALLNTPESTDGTNISLGTNYVTPAEMTALKDAIADAKNVKTAAETAGTTKTQDDVNAAEKSLDDAVIAFKAAANNKTGKGPSVKKDALIAAVSAAEQAKVKILFVKENSADVPDGEHYVTQTEMDAFSNAIAAANDVLKNSADQTAIDNAVGNLNTAKTTFDTAAAKTGTKTGDLTGDDLAALITAAEALANGPEVGTDPGAISPLDFIVSEAEMKAFTDAIGIAKAVTENYDIEFDTLKTAIKNFESAIQQGTDPAPARAELETEIINADNAKEGVEKAAEKNMVTLGNKWATTDEWTPFDNAYIAAVAANNNFNATHNMVVEAKTALAGAITDFTNKVNARPLGTKELYEEINKANAAKEGIVPSEDGEDVSPTSKWVTESAMTAFEEAINDAETVRANDDSTAEQLNTALDALKEAENNFNPQFGKMSEAAPSLDEGIIALEAGNFDAAIASFDAAYDSDNTNPQAIIYSTLGKLASIAKSEQIKTLLKDRVGVKSYPGTIDGLVSPDWFNETFTSEDEPIEYYWDGNYSYSWVDEDNPWIFDYYGIEPRTPGYYYYDFNDTRYKLGPTKLRYYESAETSLPSLDLDETISWMTGSQMYDDSKSRKTGEELLTTTNYMMLLFANLVEKNTNGLNSLLDGILSSVFGTNFDNAVSRADLLADNAYVEMSAASLEALGLSKMFESGETVYIGTAELKTLFSAMRFVRASLEWITAYNWDTNLSFLTDAGLWEKEAHFENMPDKNSLPLFNNFLKDRGYGMMDKSKASFIKAIDEAIAAYTIMTGDDSNLPDGYIDTLKDYKWVKEGFTALRAAINGEGGNSEFYAKEYSEGVQTYVNNADNAVFGIDLAKFFTPGQLSLNNLVETETDGKTPKFYGYVDYAYAPPAVSGNFGHSYTSIWAEDAFTSTDQIDEGLTDSRFPTTSYDNIGINFKLEPLKQIIVFGLGREQEEDMKKIALFPLWLGKEVFDWYHQ